MNLMQKLAAITLILEWSPCRSGVELGDTRADRRQVAIPAG
jgi:hypothetical protein